MKIVELPAARHTMARALSVWPENGLDDTPLVRRQGRMWEMAQMYWVTPDMTRVALDASQDMPEYTLAELMPTEVGLIHFDGGLPALPAIAAGKQPDAFGGERYPEVPADWMLWWLIGKKLHVAFGCLGHRLEQSSFAPVDLPYVEMGVLDFPDINFNVMPDASYVSADRVDNMKISLVTMLAATWTMMKQESVAESRPTVITPTRNEARRGRRPGTVTTVSLRRMRVVTTEHDDTGHKLTHRHVVRGHWRQQAWGPNQSLRRPTWVPSYVKGPEGAPLIRSEKVMVWRR